MLQCAAVFGAAAVLLGAFAAHGLKGHLSAADLARFEVGARYQMYHALALGLCSLLARTGSAPRWSARLFALGIVLFSGSLYAMPWLGPWTGAITPFGGVAFVAGWLLLLRHAADRSPMP